MKIDQFIIDFLKNIRDINKLDLDEMMHILYQYITEETKHNIYLRETILEDLKLFFERANE